MQQGLLGPTKPSKPNQRGLSSLTQIYFGNSIGECQEVAVQFEEIVCKKKKQMAPEIRNLARQKGARAPTTNQPKV